MSATLLRGFILDRPSQAPVTLASAKTQSPALSLRVEPLALSRIMPSTPEHEEVDVVHDRFKWFALSGVRTKGLHSRRKFGIRQAR